MTVINPAVSSFATTGTIGAGSNSLVVASASGLAVNDYLIVEIGNEAGAGLRGTIGVGGAWPNRSYANLAAMNADTSQLDGTYAYLVDTKAVYRSWSGVWQSLPVGGLGGDNYYVTIAVPRSLTAKITAKAGTTLTLDRTATVATTNANVYFDNTRIIQAMTDYGSTVVPDGSEVAFPSGRFAISEQCIAHNHSSWDFHGAGKTATTFFYPKGISGSSMLGCSTCNYMTFRDFGLEGNAKAQGYMPYFYPGSETAAIYNSGLQIISSPNTICSDIKGLDCFKTFSVEQGSNNTIVRRVECVLTDGIWVEIWHASGNDSTSIAFSDISVTSPTWMPGIEFFHCVNSSMTRITGTNAFFAMNTNNTFMLQDITLAFSGAAKHAYSIFTTNSPLVDINPNIGGADISGGGTLRDITITQTGTAGPGNDTLRAIVIGAANVNVKVQHATITLPNYVSGSTLNGAVGLLSDAPDTEVVHFTCHGTTNPPSGVSRYANLNLTGGTYRCAYVDSVKGVAPNCRADPSRCIVCDP